MLLLSRSALSSDEACNGACYSKAVSFRAVAGRPLSMRLMVISAINSTDREAYLL